MQHNRHRLLIYPHMQHNRHRLLIHGNIAKKSAKSPIYRTDKSEKNREWRHARRSRMRSPIAENIADISVFLPIFRQISRYFLPVQPAHSCPIF